MNTRPKVSVIIPTYKRSEMLIKAINSVLKQSYSNIEVLVIDDNDPDSEWRKSTSQKMETFKNDIRVRYICHDKNLNGATARNTGIKYSSGEIVSFLDDDDVYRTNKIELQVEYLLSHTEYRAVICGWFRCDNNVIPPHEGDISFDILSGYNIVYTNTIMMWKEDAINCGGFDTSFKRHQEASFLLRYMRNGGKIGVVKKVLVDFNIDDRSNEASPEKNELYTIHYLETFKDMIDRCEKNRKGSKKEIWIGRMRGIWVNYVKKRDFIGALKCHRRMAKKMPLWFTLGLFKYICVRPFGRFMNKR